MDHCHFCGNKNIRDAVCRCTYQRDDKYLMVDQVPCRQCEYCGEQYFAAGVLKKIELEFEAIHLHGKVPKLTVDVPIERFVEIQQVA